MCHKDITIKRRLLVSNIRMILISFIAFGFAARMVAFFFDIPNKPSPEAMENFRNIYNADTIMIMWLMVFAIFIILISVINNFLTHRMVKRIIKPLDPLNNGVRQIQDNNLSYRIEYNNDDEFRPVCDAFNEMAERLETSADQKKKDEANRRELIAGISHDLRTPLTSIKGCIEGIETCVAATPEMKEKYLTIIKNKTIAIEHIIEQLFLFSKLDMNEFPLSMRRVDIALAISDIIEDSAHEYERRGLSICLTAMPQNIYINADVLMFRNVIINILENSVKYKTGEHCKIEISIEQINDFVILRMADNGPGVQPDMLPKLFDVFYRTDPSRSKMGSGLGLAISGKIIERMGGKIFAEPSVNEPEVNEPLVRELPEGGGLAVILQFPIVQEEET